MERKKLISRIDRAHTTPEQQAAIDHHIEQGYRITNMKETLLHSVVSFTSLEEGSYAVDKALKEKIGNRAKILFGYAISSGNECPICGNYFKWVLEDQLGIKDFDHFEFTDEEMELLKKADKNCRLIKGQVFLWEGADTWEDLWDIDGTIPGWHGYEKK